MDISVGNIAPDVETCQENASFTFLKSLRKLPEPVRGAWTAFACPRIVRD